MILSGKCAPYRKLPKVVYVYLPSEKLVEVLYLTMIDIICAGKCSGAEDYATNTVNIEIVQRAFT